MQPNARLHLRPEAGARHERRLEAVRCKPWLGAGPGPGPGLGDPSRRLPPPTALGRREPAAWPDTPASRRCRVGLAPASASSVSRHPPRPARRDPRGPPALAASAHGHTPEQRGGTARGQACGGSRPRLRPGYATRAQAVCGPATPTSACLGGPAAWPRGPAGRTTSHAPRSSCPCLGGTHAAPPSACTRWRSPVPPRMGLPVLARRPPRWGRAS